MNSAPKIPNEQRRLATLHAMEILDTPPEERFDRITRLAQKLLDVPIVLISLVDEERQWFKSRQGLKTQETSRDVSFCAHAILDHPQTLVVSDALQDDRFSQNPLVTGEPKIRFYAGQPVAAPDGSPVGTLCIIDRQPRQLSQEEIALLKDLAVLAENELNLMLLTQQQKAHQQALRKESAKAQAQARYTSLLLENVPVGVVVINDSGSFTQVNQAFANIVDYSSAELLTMNFRALSPPNRLAADMHYCQMAFSGQDTGRYETERLRKDGTRVPVQINATPLRDDAGAVIGLLASVEDITERKQAEQRIRQLNSELEQRVAARTAELSQANTELARANRLKDEFLATMSHELRTPLNAVLGLSESLEEGVFGPLNPDQLETIQDIATSGKHLLALISDILELSKIEAGKLRLQPQPVLIEDMCRTSLRMFQPAARKNNLKVVTTFDNAVTTIVADARLLKQMLVNLLSNAVKFTPAGGQIGLEVLGDKDRQRAHFIVWDTGIGIAQADMGRLFQPFVQLDSRLSRQYEGTGLGLTLVDRLARLHGGSVHVESEVGKGSRFTISLPWTEAPVDATDRS